MDLLTLFEQIIAFVDFLTPYWPFILFGLFALLFVFNPPWKWAEKLDDYDKLVEKLIDVGVVEPAVVVSAKSGGTLKTYKTSKRRKVQFTVDVFPQNGTPPFRSTFVSWKSDRLYSTIIFNNIVGEAGRKAWVIYNPHDPSQIILDHYDEEHEFVMAERKYVKARNHFIDMENIAIQVRETGVETLATILEIEELGIETPKEKKEGRAFWLKLNIMPHNGANFVSETYVMVSLDTMHKLTAGKMVHVKFDPHKPEISALIRVAG